MKFTSHNGPNRTQIWYKSTVNDPVKPLKLCTGTTLDLFGSSVTQIIFEICLVAIVLCGVERKDRATRAVWQPSKPS